MNPVAMSEGFAVHGLHQKQLEIIWRTKILRYTRLTDSFLAIRSARGCRRNPSQLCW
jgi:hypothetical protein